MSEGFYIRYVASKDDWVFYYYHNRELRHLDGDDWMYSIFSKPYKAEGFKKVKL